MVFRLMSHMTIILDVTDGVKIYVTDDDNIGCHRWCYD